MCIYTETANVILLTTGPIRSMVIGFFKKRLGNLGTKRPCNKNNEPMPRARQCLLWERKEPRWRGTSWYMSRGKAEGPATAWDEGQRNERYSKQTWTRKARRWHHFVWQVFRQRPAGLPYQSVRNPERFDHDHGTMINPLTTLLSPRLWPLF